MAGATWIFQVRKLIPKKKKTPAAKLAWLSTNKTGDD
jgi:hypothetical protein